MDENTKAKLLKLERDLEVTIADCDAKIEAAESTASAFRAKRKRAKEQLAQVKKQLAKAEE